MRRYPYHCGASRKGSSTESLLSPSSDDTKSPHHFPPVLPPQPQHSCPPFLSVQVEDESYVLRHLLRRRHSQQTWVNTPASRIFKPARLLRGNFAGTARNNNNSALPLRPHGALLAATRLLGPRVRVASVRRFRVGAPGQVRCAKLFQGCIYGSIHKQVRRNI
jgi:hypothetical protein